MAAPSPLHCLRFVDVASWDPSTPEWGRLLHQLSVHEQQQVMRFMFAKDQKLALGSRLLQRQLIHDLFGVSYGAVDIARTPENKPYWKRPTESPAPPLWNYNVSHHGTVVAIASAAHALVGVDVVQLTDRPRRKTSVEEFFRAFTDHFNPREWGYIRGTASTESGDEDGQYTRFYRLWSLKEAYIKAVGIGLGFSLLRAEFVRVDSAFDDQWELFLDGHRAGDWHFTSTQVNDAHLVSAAYGPFSARWRPEASSIFPHVDFVEITLPGYSIDEDENITAWHEWRLQDLIQ
ncbi:hypothetical protein PRIC2_003037 [Phytophthora ramorum]